jgi:hypothetical protein
MRPEENRRYIEELVRRYDDFAQSYESGTFNEAQLRKEYIDVFFRALGWDIDNAQGHHDSYKEVVVEDPIKLRGTMGHIDYSFRIGGVRKFIVETKKPGVNIRDDKSAALQVRTYAWNARLPLNILTDFEEWAIYDCTKKPAAGDTAATARIEYFTYRELPEKWDHLVEIFSKERILQGSFDRFVASTKGKKGTVSVDKDILALIESWRDLLARNLALRNPALSVDDLNIAVQRIIDRILFLRICEDRGIETYETLKGLLEGDGVYGRLCTLFERADDRYNSGLFHFSNEPGWDEMPDSLTPGLVIDDKVLKEVVKRLYWPESQYEFSVIPPAILGQVYEQFLGKVIRLTDGHQAKVEFKPEVKKAGGVFYTPEYIVDYIVKETVGRLVADKTPAEVSSVRVLDPACGSGSFLLGAYDYLLDWHLDWYVEHLVPLLAEGRTVADPAVRALLPLEEVIVSAGKKRRTELRPVELPVYRTGQRTDERGKVAGSYWRLKTAERKRILLNNLYGVDIDQQAVEVTKLSLLLKVLEDETTIGQATLGTERALPSLHRNVRCGNSLIGRDVLADRTLSDEEIMRINPFDWERGFPAIMAAGGFDAVIGNPPYVRQELISAQKAYLKSHYQVFAGTADLYTYFIERALSLMNDHGQFSFIVANKWMRANYGKPLRQFLKSKRIEEIIDFGDLPVFENATTYPCIIRIAGGEPCETLSGVNVEDLQFEDLKGYVNENRSVIAVTDLDDDRWSLIPKSTLDLLVKLRIDNATLDDYVHGGVYRGIITGLTKAFVIDEETYQRLIHRDGNSAQFIRPFLLGRDVKRYLAPHPQGYVIAIPKGWTNANSGGVRNKWAWFQQTYPALAEHLEPFQKEAEARNDKGEYWWELRTCDYYSAFEKPKIIYPEICSRPEYGYDAIGSYANNKCFIIPSEDRYLLGLLNSTLTFFYYEMMLPKLRGGFFMPAYVVMRNLPIRPIDPENPDDMEKHDRMVSLVETMLDLHRRLPTAATEHQRRLLEMQVEATDREIDALVYALYNLTPDEIAVVEAAVGKAG